jgi:rod shape-determining protein MreD
LGRKLGELMVKFLIYSFFFFIAAILQTVVVSRIDIYGAQPSFLLILTVITALRQGSLAGCLIGFMSGLLCDTYAPVQWLGAFSLAYCVVGFVVGQIEESFINLKLFPKIIVLTLADFLKDAIYYFSIRKSISDIPYIVYSLSLPNAIYTVILGAICFYIFLPKTEKQIEMYRRGI